MSSGAKTAITPGSPTTPAATATARSARRAVARDWLAKRQAELLPVPDFHVVFTLPAAIADIAYQNKASALRSAIPGLVRDAADDRRRTRSTWAPGSGSPGAPHLGLGNDPSSAHPHDRAGRRPRPDGSAGSLPNRASSCRCACSRALPQADAEKLAAAHAAGKLQFFGATVISATPTPSPPSSRRSGRSGGSSTPRGPSPDRRRCSPISRATPTASRSPTAA